MVLAVAHFLFGVASGVANEGQIGLNSSPTCNNITFLLA